MLIVRGTKKLRDRMNKAPSASPDDGSSTALGDWFATALFWKPQAALLVNARTMIPVFTPLAPPASCSTGHLKPSPKCCALTAFPPM